MTVSFDTELLGPPATAPHLWALFGPRVCSPYGFLRNDGSSGGYLAGSSPDGLVTVNAAPAEASVQVSVRYPGDYQLDGLVVTTVRSNGSGEWEVGPLFAGAKYTVVGFYPDYRPVAHSPITPAV